VAIAKEIANTDGVDVVFVASTDLASFSGYKQGPPEYEALVKQIHTEVLKAGKYLAGPLAWKGVRDGYTFFQGPSETALLRSGATMALGAKPVGETKRGIAPTEGSEK
jgi:2-keto-3-deoxy-L-rhamnonate aldolase RhmA